MFEEIQAEPTFGLKELLEAEYAIWSFKTTFEKSLEDLDGVACGGIQL